MKGNGLYIGSAVLLGNCFLGLKQWNRSFFCGFIGAFGEIHQHTSWEGRHSEARLGIEARVDRRRIGAAVSVSAGQRLGRLLSDRSGTRGGQDSGPTDDCGVGKRGTDCKEKKIFIVRLRHHRTLWFDEMLAEVHFTLTNAKLGVRYVCKGPGVKTIFTEAWVQGEDKHKSNYKKFEACS
jgi:hypothetical protein